MKILIFIWKLYNNAIRVGSKLNKTLLGIPLNCLFGGAFEETNMHLFVHYEFKRIVWFGSNLGIRTCSLEFIDIRSLLGSILHNSLITSDDGFYCLRLCLITFWCIWKARYNVVFRGIIVNPRATIACWNKLSEEYIQAFQSHKDLVYNALGTQKSHAKEQQQEVCQES